MQRKSLGRNVNNFIFWSTMLLLGMEAHGFSRGIRTVPSTSHHGIKTPKIFADFKAIQDSETLSEGLNLNHKLTKSYIAEIAAFNLAGASNSQGGDEIRFTFCPNFCAVTGETGSGKSLLLRTASDLILGKKPSMSLFAKDQSSKPVKIHVVAQLCEPNLQSVNNILDDLGLPHCKSKDNLYSLLELERTLWPTDDSKRLKSKCKINGEICSLKSLTLVASCILTTVDAPAASSALQRPSSRLALVDCGVALNLQSDYTNAKRHYRICRDKRRELELEMEQSQAFLSNVKDNVELLQHWVDELDAFQQKMLRYRTTLTETILSSSKGQDSLYSCCKEFSNCSWDTEAFYNGLVELRRTLKSIETQLETLQRAQDRVSSSKDSAVAALEQTRTLLFEVDHDALEHTHDLLNEIELLLSKCAASIENGVSEPMLEVRQRVPVTLDDLDWHIAQWNALGRKHGLASPSLLPQLQRSLRMELDGTHEAQLKLPQAHQDEQEALQWYISAHKTLHDARSRVANKLSSAVTQKWLPELGMEGSEFVISVQTTNNDKTTGASIPGEDTVHFALLHHGERLDRSRDDTFIASSGEKARILLALETELPGSVGAMTASTLHPHFCPPVAVLYDEIDAHVGGRAVVSLAHMLSGQSYQVVCITHSTSVAAMADQHISIQKTLLDSKMMINVKSLMESQERKLELARMASGNLAQEEAEAFADALLAMGEARRKMLRK